jgi:hypothetical protein
LLRVALGWLGSFWERDSSVELAVPIPGGDVWRYSQLLVDRGGQECPPHTRTVGAGERQILRCGRNDKLFSGSLLLVAAAEVVDEHLFYRLVVGHEDVADGVAAYEVADFFGEVFRVIAGAFEGLGHEYDLQTGLAGDVFGILDVAEEDQIAEAVHFGVGADDVDGFAYVAVGEGVADIGQHFFKDGGHVGEVAGIFGIDAAGSGLSAVREAKEQVADALETDHELHTGEEFAGFDGLDFSDKRGDGAVDFPVEGVEFALALAEGIEQWARAGGDALGRCTSRFLCQTTGFNRAPDNVMMGRFGSEAFDSGSTHEAIPSTRGRTTQTD